MSKEQMDQRYGECNSEPQGVVTSHLSGQITIASGAVEKRGPCCTVDGHIN